jgi:hypothetical protein
MPTLHDTTYRTQLELRIRAVRPDSTRVWGKMSPDQMFRHINVGLSMANGETALAELKSPLPRPVMKFLVLNLPWPKGAPTAPAFLAEGTYDLESERARCLELVGTVAGRPLDSLAQKHPMFGAMSGKDVSRLQAKHLDHHLRQFGV